MVLIYFPFSFVKNFNKIKIGLSVEDATIVIILGSIKSNTYIIWSADFKHIRFLDYLILGKNLKEFISKSVL